MSLNLITDVSSLYPKIMLPSNNETILVLFHSELDVINLWAEYFTQGMSLSGADLQELMDKGWEIVGVL